MTSLLLLVGTAAAALALPPAAVRATSCWLPPQPRQLLVLHPARVPVAPRCQQVATLLETDEGESGTLTAAGGRLHTPESRAKISAANKGRTPWNAGRKHSEETRQRIAEATRKAMQRRMEERKLERERLRLDEPQVYQALVAKEAAAEAAAAALKEAERKQKSAERRRERLEKRLVRQQRAEASGNGTAKVRSSRVTIGSSRVNFTFTAESRAKISESVRKRWQDPNYRARRSNISVSQETRAKLSEAMKAKWLNGSYRERNSTSNAHSAERRSKIAAAIRAKWAEPGYRERATIVIRLARLNATASRRARGGVQQVVSEEVRAKLSMTMKRVWAQRREKDLTDRVAAELFLADKEGREPRLLDPLPRRVHRVHNGVLSTGQWRPPQRGGAVTSLGVSGTRAAGMQERRPESLAEDASTTERWQAMAVEEAQAEAQAKAEALAEEHAASAKEAGEEDDIDLIAWGNTIIDFGDDIGDDITE